MPQFELTPFLSQAFWMLISFGFMYLIISYLIFPLLEDVFQERETIIKTDLQIAARVNAKADELVKNYNAYIFDAQQQKAAMIKRAYEDMHRESAEIEKLHEREVRVKIKETENNLREINRQLHAQSDAAAVQIAQELAQKFFGDNATTAKRRAPRQEA